MCQRRPAWLPGPATRPVSLSCIGCNASPCAAQRQLSALLSAFPPGATYNFAAQAINGAGSGPWSANVSLTTPIRWDACCCASASFSRAAVGCTHACMHARLPEAAGSVPVPASRETVACTSLHRPPPPSDGPSCRSLYRLAQAPRRPHHRAVHCKEPQPCQRRAHRAHHAGSQRRRRRHQPIRGHRRARRRRRHHHQGRPECAERRHGKAAPPLGAWLLPLYLLCLLGSGMPQTR